MDKFLNLVISGTVTGAIYSIMASGLVLTYQTSGIFNFAHAAVAFTSAYLYFQLNSGLRVPNRPVVDHHGVLLRSAARPPARPHRAAAIGEGARVRPDRRHHRVTRGAADFDPVAGGHGRRLALDLGLGWGPRSRRRGTGAGRRPASPRTCITRSTTSILNTDQLAVFVVAALAAVAL